MTNARKTILVIDDDKDFRTEVFHMLEDEYQILDARDPKTALALALGKNPDCILLDLSPPDVSGAELCTILSDMNATKLIPVIVISGHSAARFEEIRKVIRVAGFMQKPFELRELKERITTAVEAKQGERRREGRARLPIALRIVGADTAGDSFDTVIMTHDVSANGFSWDTSLSLPIGSSLEAWITAGEKTMKGEALIVRVENRGTPAQRYGFRLIKKPENWVLQ